VVLGQAFPSSVSWGAPGPEGYRGQRTARRVPGPRARRDGEMPVAFADAVAETAGMALLERGASLASLAEYAQEARLGEGRLVLVGGEAGVGKSALVDQFARDEPAARWSWGACDGLFTPRPLGPLFDIAEQLGGELLGLCRARAAREELFGALLRQVSDSEALNVVVIEDVHWADEATLDLLGFLSRRVRNAAVLLIATYRTDGLAAGDPLRLALGELGRHRTTRRIVLAPLSQNAVGLLAAGSGLEAGALFRLTGGNPFYVTEVVRSGRGQIPASARDAVLARVETLDSESRELLEAAALIGTRVELRLLDLVTSSRSSAVDELIASGLLAGDGGWLSFRHEIARLAVGQAVAAHRRLVLHARILQAMQSLPYDDDARLAFHAESAADGPAVRRHAPAAARQAAELGSHREAAAQLERALRFSAGADPVTIAGWCDGLAAELALLDRWQGAVEAGERALELWRAAGDRRREGDTLRSLSCALQPLGRGRDAVAAAEAAVAILEPLGSAVELARAYSSLASERMVTSEHQAAIDLAVRAQAMAGPLGALDVVSDALNTQGCSVAAAGGAGTGYLRRALEIALAAGLQDQAGRGFGNLLSTHAAHRRFAEADACFADGLAFCGEHDLTAHAAFLRRERAGALERTGRWDEALALSTELLRGAGAAPLNRLGGLRVLGLIRARRGEPGAWEDLDEAAAAADQSGEPQWIVPVRLARAEAYWLDAEPGRAGQEAELALDVSAGSGAWERGEIGSWLRRAQSGRAPSGALAEPYRLQAEGDWEGAARSWAGLGCPYEQALALFDGADEASWREALRIFTELGASAAARITRQKMREVGIQSIPAGPRPVTRAHPLGLTPREHEILDLISSRRTNAEIAAQLFISRKTVDHHVSAVLAKLGVSTRGAAAARAARLGLAGAAET
jgi:DNA-binding CsgD family transcriptional regulator/tetratricopeptide (TPR) repeat protein